jgi:F-type H+-transporting ATPase subunit a
MASTESSFLQIKQHIPEIEAHTLFEIGSFPVKDSFLMILLLTFVFIGLVFFVARFKLVPGRFQSFCEYIYEAILNLMTQVIGSEKRAQIALPIVGSIMLYIGIANLIPLIPFISAFKFGDYHLLRPATADFNTTFGLALAVVVSTQLIGIKEWGFFKFISRYFPIQDVYHGFKKGIGAGFESIIHLFVGVLELIGEAAKAISLSMRLFGNIFAHEVLTVVIIGAFAYILPVVWMGFGILVGVVQAMVFGILVSIYYGMVIKEGDGKGGH